jgi:hypothetical protein
MKEARKTGNIVIRENSKRSSRDESNKLKPIPPPNQDPKKITQTKIEANFELQK